MSTTPTNPEPRIPDSLTSDLRSVYRSHVGVPASIDSAMLDLARRRPSRKRRVQPWVLVKWAGVAAAVVAAFIVPTHLSRNSPLPTIALHSGDINGDGIIDILDAFTLARAQANGDGSITNADITAAGMAAVKLGGGA